MNTAAFDKGSVIFRQGDFPKGMYDIVCGSVGVYVNYGKENETQLTVLKAGDFLGEMGMIEIRPRSASAVAMEDGTELREIGTEEFSAYFESQPERLLAIMRQLSRRLRDQTEDYEAASRVLAALKETADQPEKRDDTLMDTVRKYLSYYDSVVNVAYQDSNGAFNCSPFIYREFF